MDTIFRLCFHFLHALADITGLSYEAVNVIIFVFIGPAVFLTLAYRWYQLERRHGVLQGGRAPSAGRLASIGMWFVGAVLLIVALGM
jgi:hypothetical protein